MATDTLHNLLCGLIVHVDQHPELKAIVWYADCMYFTIKRHWHGVKVWRRSPVGPHEDIKSIDELRESIFCPDEQLRVIIRCRPQPGSPMVVPKWLLPFGEVDDISYEFSAEFNLLSVVVDDSHEIAARQCTLA